ncbi:protein phosphatase 1G-like [Clavelina lepadiformis]|uniref:protein phosphatase 1G-like n=1 Tax=Clavelina lepadiformis TaxID=159417 RepID=UPI0040428115
MGAYLSTPSKEKKSDEFPDNDKFSCGVSGMQGWRISMEDAYNCEPDIGNDTAFFSVYDGHGGGEVAIYCSHHFVEIMKETKEYKDGKMQEALKQTFMEIDRKLKAPEVIQELKLLSEIEPGDAPPTEEQIQKMVEQDREDAENAEDETRLLHEEATMNIEDLLAKYGRVVNETKEMMNSFKDDDFRLQSSYSKKVSSRRLKLREKSCKADTENTEDPDDEVQPIAEGKQTDLKECEVVDKSSGVNEEDVNPKKLTKTFVKNKPAKMPDDDDETDEDYDGFESDEAVEGSSSDEESESSEEEESTEEIEDEYNEKESEEKTSLTADSIAAVGSTIEEPGSDSGTTAVVALLHGFQLHVANAGDSRCVLCRKDGKAFDMSDDHKPEDETELSRIKAAGGHVNLQGRVNGGLNLSRAIGDHCYKTNKDLPLEEQMISAMPDVRSVVLDPDDEFMVLACDGVWNVFTSQEVVDFVRDRLNSQESNKNEQELIESCEKVKLSEICEELFDKCLAPDTMGDGTGCDNMTCLIIKFNKDWLKKNATKPDAVVQSDKVLKKSENEICLRKTPDVTSSSEADSDMKESGDYAVTKDNNDVTIGEDGRKNLNKMQEKVAVNQHNKRVHTDEQGLVTCVNGNGASVKRLKTE